MDDMQFSKYSADTREILKNTDKDKLEILVRNVVKHVTEENNSKCNWLARELFCDVVDNELISNIFDQLNGAKVDRKE